MREAFAFVGLLLVLALAPAAYADEECEGARSGQIRARLERVAGHAAGSASFTINPRFTCAEVVFRWSGVFTADRPEVDLPDSVATVHQVVVVGGVARETWFNVTIPETNPFGTSGFGFQPWYPGAPIDITWDVTGAGSVEFSYHGYD